MQTNFFYAGVYRLLMKLCEMSKIEFDSSELKKDLLKEYMGEDEPKIKSSDQGYIENIS